MQAQQTQQHRLWGVLLASVFLSLWFSVEIAQAAPKQEQCLKTVFTTLESQNPDQDIKDFNADLNKAKKAIQNAPNFGPGPAGQLIIAVSAIVCHLAEAKLQVTSKEQKMRLTEAIAKLRNIFKRIAQANFLTEADKIKDWLAKLFFLEPDKFLKFKVNHDYLWNLIRLELILDNTGKAQEPDVFVVQPGWADIDLILLSRSRIDSNERISPRGQTTKHWGCALDPNATNLVLCTYAPQDGLFFVQTKDVDNANDVLFTQQGGRQVAGGQDTLQYYTEIVLKHIGASAAQWRNDYASGAQVACLYYDFILRLQLQCPQSICGPAGCVGIPFNPPPLPKLELIVGILFWSGNIINADKVKQEITGLGLPAGQALNAAQISVRNALNKEVKGLVIGWRVIQPPQRQIQYQYSCVSVQRDALAWGQCDTAVTPQGTETPLRLFRKNDAGAFVCFSFGQSPTPKNKCTIIEKG